MTNNDAIVAVFTKHREAESAIHKLAEGGLDIKHFSIIEKRLSFRGESDGVLQYRHQRQA